MTSVAMWDLAAMDKTVKQWGSRVQCAVKTAGQATEVVLLYACTASLINSTNTTADNTLKCHTTENNVPSVLWRCWLGGRKGIRPVKNWVVGCWRGYLSAARCRRAYVPADAAVSCFSNIQIGLPFWYRLTRVVRDKGPLNGCVCACERENNVTVYDTGTCTLQLKTAFLASRQHLRSADTRKLIVQRTPTVIDATAVVWTISQQIAEFYH